MLHRLCPWCGHNLTEASDRSKPEKSFFLSYRHVSTCQYCGKQVRVKISLVFISTFVISLIIMSLFLSVFKETSIVFSLILSIPWIFIPVYVYSQLPYVPFPSLKAEGQFIEKEVDIQWFPSKKVFPPKLRIWNDEVLNIDEEDDKEKCIRPFIIIESFSSNDKQRAKIRIPVECPLRTTFSIIDEAKVIAQCTLINNSD